jgi:hypothetical protein
MPEGGDDAFLHETAEHLNHEFAIHHTTIQIEREDVSGVCHVNSTSQGCCWPKRNTREPDQTCRTVTGQQCQGLHH